MRPHSDDDWKVREMASAGLKVDLDEVVGHGLASGFPRAAILNQLERVVHSAHFRNSKRYPALLSYIVQETLAGRTDSLKERTLGAEVFGRPIDYDTNADPVVRVTAGEVRKRLAQYYQTPGNEHELRLDLPLGSYVPHFFPPSPETHPVESASEIRFEEDHGLSPPSSGLMPPNSEHVVHRLSTAAEERLLAQEPMQAKPLPLAAALRPAWALRVILVAALVGAAVIATAIYNHPKDEAGVSLFWKPLLLSRDPALIVVGVHSFDSSGRDISPATHAGAPNEPQSMLSSMIRSDMVPVSDVISYGDFTGLLSRNAHAYRTQGAAETTLDQLRGGPILLIGGFNNLWTMRLTSVLRYRLVAETESLHVIQDSANPAVSWKFDNAQSAMSNSRDYAIVGSFFDSQIEQYVLFAAGIGADGTAAAAEFLTNNNDLLRCASCKQLRNHQNIEIVLSTEIIEGHHGPPQEVASYVW